MDGTKSDEVKQGKRGGWGIRIIRLCSGIREHSATRAAEREREQARGKGGGQRVAGARSRALKYQTGTRAGQAQAQAHRHKCSSVMYRFLGQGTIRVEWSGVGRARGGVKGVKGRETALSEAGK